MKIQNVLVITTLTLFAINPWHMSLAQVNGQRILDSAIHGAVDGAFSEAERQLISRYFRVHSGTGQDKRKGGGKYKKAKKGKGMPPGLARKNHLPPGLQKQLDRNGTLPPGLAKRSLPADLEERLSPPPKGMERVIADTHVLLVDKASGIIKDIIKDIVR